MKLDDWQFVTLAVGLLGGFLTLFAKQVRTDFKVNIMWASWMKHAENMAESSGLMRKNSPIRLTEAGIKIFKELNRDEEFMDFWKKSSHGKSVDQVSAIEKILGEELLNSMRQKNGVHEIEIIISAIQYARELSEPLKTEEQKKAG